MRSLRCLALAAVLASMLVGCGEPPVGPVEIHVVEGGVPLAGAPVLWHTAAGEQLALSSTDAAGRAIAEVPEGSAVTVIRADEAGNRADLLTIGALVLGDQIEVDSPGAAPERAFEPMLANVPPWSGHDVDAYEVHGSCVSQPVGAGWPSTVAVDSACFDGPQRIVAVAYDRQRQPLGYILLDQVAMVPDGTIDFPDTWRPTGALTVTISDIPAGAELVVRSAQHVGAVDVFENGWQERELPGGGATELTFFTIPDLGDITIRAARLDHAYSPLTDLLWQQFSSGTPDSIEFALTPPPPAPGNVSPDGDEQHWVLSGEGSADATLAELTYTAPISNTSVTWETILPPDETSAILPILPDTLAHLKRGSEARLAVTTIENDTLPGWDAVRAAPSQAQHPAATDAIIKTATSHN